jgi:hypothetical protein
MVADFNALILRAFASGSKACHKGPQHVVDFHVAFTHLF